MFIEVGPLPDFFSGNVYVLFLLFPVDSCMITQMQCLRIKPVV